MGMTASGGGVVQLKGRNVKVTLHRQRYETTVAPSSIAAINIMPTSGYIGRLLALGLFAPAIAGSTGNHEYRMTVGASSAFTVERIVNLSVAGTNALNVTPQNNNTLAYKHVVFDAANPLLIDYINNTDMEQAGARLIYALYEEEAVIS